MSFYGGMSIWYSLLSTHKDVSIFTLDLHPDGRMLFSSVSDSFCSMCGLSREQIIGFAPEGFLLSHDAAAFNSNLRQAVTGPYEFHEVMVLPRGRLYCHVALRPKFNADNKAEQICGIVLDLTESRRMEQALQEVERKNRALIAAMPDAIFKISSDGVFLDLEEGKDTVLGIPPMQFLGQKLEHAMPPDIAQEIGIAE